MGCDRGWEFWKPALSIAVCKLKAVPFMKLNLDVKFIR
jgi:hypothetical protein